MVLICNPFFCSRSPFIFQNRGLHSKRSLWIQRLGRRGPTAPVHKNRSLAGPPSCANMPGQLLTTGLVLFPVSLGRQADSTVTCECNRNWLSCLTDKCAPGKLQRDYQRSQQVEVIFKNRKDCFKLFSLNFILIFCVTEHRADGYEHI